MQKKAATNNEKKSAVWKPINPNRETQKNNVSLKEQRTKRNIPKWIVPTLMAAIASIVSFHYLYTENSDVLYAAQEHSFFSYDESFFDQCMQKPAGFLLWAASYLTQWLYTPLTGAILMIAMWVASFFISKKAFDVPSAFTAVLLIPIACLLVSNIQTGYWLYYIKQPGYWFAGTLGYLIAMSMALVYRMLYNTNKDSLVLKVSRLVWTAIIALSYPLFGWYSLIALGCIVVNGIFLWIRTAENRKIVFQAGEIVLAVVSVLIIVNRFAGIYTTARPENIWTAGFPAFQADNMTDFIQQRPFYIMGYLPLLFPIILPISRWLHGKTQTFVAVVATISILYFCGSWVNDRNFDDFNYHAELKMYRATMEEDWDKVLESVTDLPDDATREMVVLKNIALINKGTISSQMFHYNNMGKKPFVRDTMGIVPLTEMVAGKEQPKLDDKGEQIYDTLALKVHMVQTAGPLIYFHHGKTNFSYRWLIENSVEYGYNNGNLQLLAMNSLVNGEYDVAKKYLKILKDTPNYADWADNYMKIVNKQASIKDYHEFDNVRELRDHMGTVLDGDQGLVEMYLINYFSNTMNKDSKYLQEVTLVYSLIQKDIQLFWPRFFLYAQLHQNEEMPTHYQEAAYLYGNLEHQVDISSMPFDQKVIERYQQFHAESQRLLAQGIHDEQLAEALKPTFGDTFWWFYFFVRGIHSY